MILILKNIHIGENLFVIESGLTLLIKYNFCNKDRRHMFILFGKKTMFNVCGRKFHRTIPAGHTVQHIFAAICKVNVDSFDRTALVFPYIIRL